MSFRSANGNAAGPDNLEFPWSESIAYLLRDTYKAFAQALKDELERFNVNVGSWLFLRVLWSEDGLTQRELTRRVGLMQPNTNAALKQLARRGLIRQTTDPDDRRSINIFLTAEGRALGRSLIPIAKRIRDQSVIGLRDKDLAMLTRLLATMKQNLTSARLDTARVTGGGRRGKKPISKHAGSSAPIRNGPRRPARPQIE
jgi:MarR family transcriptional regulator, organic hydroperoxide resistance regulator